MRSAPSPLITGVVGLATGAVGALFGAWIAGRNRTKQAVVAELNSISTALFLCFSISNRYMALKRQHVRPMRNRYAQTCSEHEEFQKNTARPDVKLASYKFGADLQTLFPTSAPTHLLERHIFEKTSVRGRAVAAAVSLIQAIDDLNHAIKYRNEQIDEIRAASPLPRRRLAEIYLGLPSSEGDVDERFSAGVLAISLHTDDCIFFSHILADDLLLYSRKLRKRYAWRYRLPIRPFGKVDWTIAETEGLIPPASEYDGWLKGFKNIPSRWERFKVWGRSHLWKSSAAR
ncbi:MAG: hypothetical protein JWN71_1318 [Xanthobacteraceae bacterium]|nr:hypothetical protein [Xanthobacteraceae bacterium]